MSELKYSKIWWFGGFLLLALVVYLSVADWSFPQSEFRFSDKLNHLLAYGVLMLWFGQLVRDWRWRWLVIGLLIGLGVAMEFIQGVLPNRWFDWFDALANTLGILIAAFLLFIGADKILLWLENKTGL